MAELMAKHVARIKRLGNLAGVSVPHDAWDQNREFRPALVGENSDQRGRFIERLDISAVNEHNGWVPRDFWLEAWEKQAIVGFHLKNPLEVPGG